MLWVVFGDMAAVPHHLLCALEGSFRFICYINNLYYEKKILDKCPRRKSTQIISFSDYYSEIQQCDHQKALDANPEVDLVSILPSNYVTRLARMKDQDFGELLSI